MASPDLLINVVQTGRRITLKPETASIEISASAEKLPALLDQVGRLELRPEDKAEAAGLIRTVER